MKNSGVLILLVIFLQTLSIFATDTTANFKGKEYVEYQITNKPIETRKDKVTLRFKTTEAYGILLYSCGGQGDFLLLELKRGKLVYTGDLGSTYDQSGAHEIILDKQYNDNTWHTVTLLRENGTHVYLTIDDVTRSHTSNLDFEQLNLDKYLYVGGLGESQRLDTSCHNNVRKKNFIGCLSNVRFNSIDLLYGAIEKFTTYKTYGKLSFTCPDSDYEIFGLHKESSLLKVKRNILSKNELDYAIEFRTFEPNGHIATHLCTNGAVDLDLLSGKVRLTLSFLGLASNDAIRIDSTIKIDDGDWHIVKVVIRRNESVINLNVDTDKRVYKFHSHFKLERELGLFMPTIRFGGNTPSLPGLVTCFRKLVIDSKTVPFGSKDIAESRDVVNQCQIKDLCFPNPCLHGSKCTQSRQKTTCDCKNMEYKGGHCETCIHKRTCQEIKESGEMKSGTYKLCPNNERILRAYCDMKSGATIIRHSGENDTRVGDGKIIGTSRTKFYVHEMHYFIGKTSITDILSVSLSCQQYIRFDCYRSRLLFDVARFRHVHFKGARWLSRDAEIQHYWGGATPESRMCGCGMDRSCAKDAKGKIKDCNCDVGDSKWRFDAGFLSDKATLPVTQVQFSKGPETNDDSFFTVGKLSCYGTIPKPTKSLPDSPTVSNLIYPTVINRSMFYNGTKYGNPTNSSIVMQRIQGESIDSLFSKPWLITIVVVGALLCLLLVFLVFLLFRQQITDVIMKCVYGKHINKPRIEIEDYNRYSTATEEQSDWDIYRLSTTFPTSTPEPSYGPTDDESVNMRIRTMEDLRGKGRFKRLTGWGSRTASAPTIVGSKYSLADKDDTYYNKNPDSGTSSSHQYQTSSESKNNESLHTFESLDTDPAYSTTATDGEADSVIDTDSEFSHKSSHNSNESSLKESEFTPTPKTICTKDESGNRSSSCDGNKSDKSGVERPRRIPYNGDNYIKINGIQLPPHANGSAIYADSVKAYYPILPVNGFRQPVVRRAHPVEYGTHVTMLNNNSGCCQLPNGSVTRLVSVNRRPSVTSDSFPLFTTIPERSEEHSEEDDVITYENPRNSDGFYELYDHSDHGSPNSETKLLFDDFSSREECEREADEQIKLLKKKVIEKATNECVSG